MTSVRVGFDAWGLSGALAHTGMGQYAAHVLGGMGHIAPDIELVAYGAPHEPPPDWLDTSVEWHAPDVAAPRKLAAVASRMFTLRRAVAKDRLDLFHAPGLHVRPSLPPVPSLPCPLVVTIHDLIPLTFYGAALPRRLRWFFRWNLGRAMRARRVVTVSEASRAEIATRTGIDARMVTVIPNGVDFAMEADRSAIDRHEISQPYILFAGAYEPRKNLARALDAYAALRHGGTDHDLVAIVDKGSGHETAARAHLSSLGLDGRVHLIGGLPDAELRALYTHASALFFPSLAEGFGFPPLQAAACGVPVVAADVPAINETMDGAAVLVPPTDVDAMVAGLRRVLEDAALRARLVAAGRKRAESFTWSRSLDRHAAVYREAADAAPS